MYYFEVKFYKFIEQISIGWVFINLDGVLTCRGFRLFEIVV